MKLCYQLSEYSDIAGLENGTELAKEIYGDKACKLAFLQSKGFNVPFGFVISNEGYKVFSENDRKSIPDKLRSDIIENIRVIERETGSKFCIAANPLLLSVRGDSYPSLPHMLDAVVNIGLNDVTVSQMEKLCGNRAFAYRAYCRLIQTYSAVVLNIDKLHFDEMYKKFTQSRNIASQSDFDDIDWIDLSRLYKSVVSKQTGKQFPQDPNEQLTASICAIYMKQYSEKTANYSNYFGIPNKRSCTLIISSMVHGDRFNNSLSGCFALSDPVTGARKCTGVYAPDCSFEDITSGRVNYKSSENLSSEYPECESILQDVCKAFPEDFRSPCSYEFIVEGSKLYVTQVVPIQFTTAGLMKHVLEVNVAGVPKEEAIKMLCPDDVISMTRDQIKTSNEPDGAGLQCGYGVVVGWACFDIDDIKKAREAEASAIFVKQYIDANDFQAILLSDALVCAEGADWTTAAYICRKLRRTAAVGVSNLEVDSLEKVAKINDKEFRSGDIVAVDSQGKFYAQPCETIDSGLTDPNCLEIMRWAAEMCKGRFFAFSLCSSPEEVSRGKSRDAEGFSPVRLDDLVADEVGAIAKDFITNPENEALEPLSDKIVEVLSSYYRASFDRPINVELLDNALRSYLPTLRELIKDVSSLNARKEGAPDTFTSEMEEELQNKTSLIQFIKTLQQENVLIGEKGPRMDIMYPSLLETQVRSILKAATENGCGNIRIMIPSVMYAKEVQYIIEAVKPILEEFASYNVKIGACLTTPCACLASGEISEYADFINIDTTRLTASLLGMSPKGTSRELFHEAYHKNKIIPDPHTFDPLVYGRILNETCTSVLKRKENYEIGCIGPLVDDPQAIKVCCENHVTMCSCKAELLMVARFCAAVTPPVTIN